ncbi:MAG: phage baseplate protein [Culicoidibacterales bacterium]
MAKEQINVGQAVDDGTGDYLRRAGLKLNNNFDDIYGNLGDGNVPHAAGAWKTYDGIEVLELQFGQAYTLNTTAHEISAKLPKGSFADYGKVIKLRDVYGTWANNSVLIYPADGDTIKHEIGLTRLSTKNLDAELVYCSPGNWEFASNKLVTGISSLGSTVVKREYIAEANQTDFLDIFESGYNTDSIEVYRRGNLLYYGSQISDNSDYGSVPDVEPTAVMSMFRAAKDPSDPSNTRFGYRKDALGSLSAAFVDGVEIRELLVDDVNVYVDFMNNKRPNNNNVLTITVDDYKAYLTWDITNSVYKCDDEAIIKKLAIALDAEIQLTFQMGVLNTLDGKSIRLAYPTNEGDTIVIVSYLDGLATYRSSYTRETIRVYNSLQTPVDIKTIPGSRWVGDLPNKYRFSLSDFGLLEGQTFNPESLEVVINGTQLTRAGDADIPAFACDGFDTDDETICIANGGVWVESGDDFSPAMDASGRWRDIIFNTELRHEDIICIKWFNNEIGTVMEWDSDNGIRDRGDERWLISDAKYTRKNKLMYTDPSNPSAKTARITSEVEDSIRLENVEMLLQSIYPIGSMYINANNPNNPADYMGFGTWIRFSQGRVPVGWNEDNPSDPNFGLNYNDLDTNGNPRHSAGNTSGSIETTLDLQNIPSLISSEKSLIPDRNGDKIIGGCQFDPDDEGPAFSKYREDYTHVRPGASTQPFNIVQPFITVNIWIRTA